MLRVVQAFQRARQVFLPGATLPRFDGDAELLDAGLVVLEASAVASGEAPDEVTDSTEQDATPPADTDPIDVAAEPMPEPEAVPEYEVPAVPSRTSRRR